MKTGAVSGDGCEDDDSEVSDLVKERERDFRHQVALFAQVFSAIQQYKS